MAISKNGILGGFSGRIGNVVGVMNAGLVTVSRVFLGAGQLQRKLWTASASSRLALARSLGFWCALNINI